MSDRRLLTAAELAEFLGLRPSTILDKWQRGELPGYKIGRPVRFDLDEVLEATRRESGAAGGKAPAIPPQRPQRGYMLEIASDPKKREEDDA
jgi:excisionase family DNA binding protein